MNPFTQRQTDTQSQTQAQGEGPSTPEDQKRQSCENLPDEQKQQQKQKSYADWAKETYNTQYEKWMPWLEDQYLKWFGKGDNKASYVAKENLSKTKVTGIDTIDRIQDDANNLVANQFGEQGVFAPVGNFVSKEGINRAERGGKDENGEYAGEGQAVGSSLKGVLGGSS